MPVTISSSGRSMKALISGEVDHHGAGEIMAALDREIDAVLPSRLELDLSGVTFMDSSGIGLVMGRYRNLKKTGSELCITETSEQIYRVMKLAGIERLAKLEGR